ncbi:MAG: DUF169 domain-containing protein [Prevotella sp.]|jgi:hypothetical protein
MDIKTFITTFRKAFGDTAPLPIAFGYSTVPAEEPRKIPRCLIGAISKVRNGNPLTLTAENVKCGGGGFYTGMHELPEYVPTFVSGQEHYKQTPEMVMDYVQKLDMHVNEKPYLNFVRIDKLDSLDDVEAILFWATPDILSGLTAWTFYDNNDMNAVLAPFGSGCASIVSLAIKENHEGGRHCFIGMLDPSARPLVPKYELTFTVPKCRFVEMLSTMKDSALFQHAFSIIKKRINGEIQKD